MTQQKFNPNADGKWRLASLKSLQTSVHTEMDQGAVAKQIRSIYWSEACTVPSGKVDLHAVTLGYLYRN